MFPQHFSPVELNNMAVHQLNDGDIRGAAQLMEAALTHLTKMHMGNETPKKKPRSRAAARFSWADKTPKLADSDTHDLIDGPFIFSRGMLVEDYDYCTNGEIQPVIAYNFGLATHLLALQTSESMLLRKAMALYCLSHRALKKLCVLGRKHHLFFTRDFQIALLNNMGQLCYQLVDYQSSSRCFAQLERNLMLLASRDGADDPSFLLNYCPIDLRAMLQSAMLETPITAPCA